MKLATLTILAVVVLAFMNPALARPSPLSTAFTYQGVLNLSGNPVNGTADFQFTLWDALSGGAQVGGPFAVNAITVTNGQFTVSIDFGSNVFNGQARWLQIAARSPAGGGPFTTLTPRQPITAVPYCLQARGIFVDTLSNVGIGTTTPDSLLTVGSPSNRGTLNVIGSTVALPVLSLTDSRPGGHQYSLYGGVSGAGNLDFFDQNAGATRLTIRSGGNVGIGTGSPGEKLTVAGSMEIGTSAGDYQHLRIGGGNNSGFLYGSYPALGDGIHMGYNYYADAAGASHIIAPDGQTSRISTGYGYIGLATGGTNQVPANRFLIDQEGTMFFYKLFGSGLAGALFTDPPAGLPTYPPGTPVRSAGALSLYGPAGNTRFGVRSRFNPGITSFPNQAELFMDDATGTTRISMTVSGEGGQQGSYGSIICTDLLVTGYKNFLVPNPDNPKQDISYASLEGPECGMYIRGTARLVAGRARVNLPETFSSLASKEGLTVILTPLSADSRGLACVNRSINSFEVVELMQGGGDYQFDWEVKAVRRGMRDYKVVHDWTENVVGGGSKDELWDKRMADIEQRKSKFEQEDQKLGPRS